ncbi:unnamed protein product [Diamesa serratosioi]
MITTSSTMESSEEFNDNSRSEFNVSEAMIECNRTYNIEMDYLKELNDTGSFPDETEKIPMCFIKCYLESADILSSDGKVNKERAVSMLWKDAGDSVDECIQEMIGSDGSCEKAYFLARCVMTRALIDSSDRNE